MTTIRRHHVRGVAVGLLALLLLWSLPARGGERAPEAKAGISADLEQRVAAEPTLADLVAYAYQASPLVRAARAEWRAAVERYRVDTALDDPEVMVEGMYMTETFGERDSPDDWKVTLTQPLPLPGKLAKASVVATTEAAIARLRLDGAVRDTTLRIRESFHELLYLREAKRLAAVNRDLLHELRKAGETAATASGRASLVDVMKAQAQTGQAGFDQLLLTESERTEATRLNSILNREAEAPIGTLTEPPQAPVVYSLSELYPLAEKNLAEIRIARASVDKAKAMVDLTRYETLPRLAIGVSYGDVNLNQQVGVQAGLSLPLWLGKNAGRMGVARAEAEKVRAEWSAQVNDSRASLREVYFRLQNAERLVLLYRDDLIPQANRAMETAATWYKEGQGSLTDYSETVAAWYNFQLALARAKADYGKFLARLESLAGCVLTERGAEPSPSPDPAGESK